MVVLGWLAVSYERGTPVWVSRCQVNSARVRQSRPDSGLDLQVKVLKPFKLFPLRSEVDYEVIIKMSLAEFHMQTLVIYKLGFNQNY